MEIRDRRALKEAARQKLSTARYNPRRLALIHAGVSLGAALLITLIDYYLNNFVEVAGGLSGMGARSILGTVRMTLQYALTLATPFWSIGFVFAAIRMARGEDFGPRSLLEGFRRFGPVLRLRLMEGVLFFGAAVACVYIGSFLFALTPFSVPMMEKMLPMMESAGTMEQMQAALLEVPMEELVDIAVPFMVIFGILYLAVAGFLFYRFRVADFILMDQPKTGALLALAFSSRMSRRRKWQLLKLDLSFWWYYGGLLLSAVVCYGDLLLPLLGVELPLSSDAAWLVFYVLGMLVQLALCWYGQSYLQSTWAVAYDVLRQQPEEAPKPRPIQATQNLPWDDTYQQMEQ